VLVPTSDAVLCGEAPLCSSVFRWGVFESYYCAEMHRSYTKLSRKGTVLYWSRFWRFVALFFGDWVKADCIMSGSEKQTQTSNC
jgi:hypothetical protein